MVKTLADYIRSISHLISLVDKNEGSRYQGDEINRPIEIRVVGIEKSIFLSYSVLKKEINQTEKKKNIEGFKRLSSNKNGRRGTVNLTAETRLPVSVLLGKLYQKCGQRHEFEIIEGGNNLEGSSLTVAWTVNGSKYSAPCTSLKKSVCPLCMGTQTASYYL